MLAINKCEEIYNHNQYFVSKLTLLIFPSFELPFTKEGSVPSLTKLAKWSRRKRFFKSCQCFLFFILLWSLHDNIVTNLSKVHFVPCLVEIVVLEKQSHHKIYHRLTDRESDRHMDTQRDWRQHLSFQLKLKKSKQKTYNPSH